MQNIAHFQSCLKKKLTVEKKKRFEIQYSCTNHCFVQGCPTLNSDCDVWDPMMCACLVCKPSYMYIEPQHETSNIFFHFPPPVCFVFLIFVLLLRQLYY